MKRLLFLAVAASFACSASAQTFINRNVGETIVKSTTTTNATPVTLQTVAIGTNESGIITIKAIGTDITTMASVTGTVSYKYTKANGTLTLGTVVVNDAIVADAGVSTSTFGAAASSNNIAVNLTGKAATNIRWRVIVKQYGIRNE